MSEDLCTSCKLNVNNHTISPTTYQIYNYNNKLLNRSPHTLSKSATTYWVPVHNFWIDSIDV